MKKQIIKRGKLSVFFRPVLTGMLLFIGGCAHQASDQDLAMGMNMEHGNKACKFTPALSVHCGRTPTTTLDGRGRLWVAYVVGEHVYVASSKDMGKSFSRPVKVNAVPEEIYTNGENRPKIAFGRDDGIYVSWTVVRDGPFFGDIRFSRSTNGGSSYEPVKTVNDDGLLTSHRFETLFVDSQGNIYMAWLDKRDMVASNKLGREYNGAALYYTVSGDNGATFAANHKVADYSCECCRIAMSETDDGHVAAFWRQIFADNIRDHGFAVLGMNDIISPMARATQDDWHIEACPHHGPAMVTGENGIYHVAWFTLGESRKGIFYGQYDADAGAMLHIKSVAAAGSSHPYISRVGDNLYLVWKQFDGVKTNIMLIHSADAGLNWQPAEIVSSTDDASDHPLLLEGNGRVWLSWHTSAEGLRIIPLNRQAQVGLP